MYDYFISRCVRSSIYGPQSIPLGSAQQLLQLLSLKEKSRKMCRERMLHIPVAKDSIFLILTPYINICISKWYSDQTPDLYFVYKI
jgi:hypothetical protein